MARTSAIAIAPKSACTSMEQVFKDCISGDVYQNLYRHIPTTFFAKPNNRMVVMLKLAANFKKEKILSSMSETLMTEAESDSETDSDASRSSDNSYILYFSIVHSIKTKCLVLIHITFYFRLYTPWDPRTL